jgi:hypothetical protein
MIAGCRIPRAAAIADRPRLSVPARFQPPRRLGNWEYFLAAEQQGQTPRCVAHSMCAILQAAAWRQFGYPIQFAEGPLYAACKVLDGDGGDGTWLETAIAAAQQADYSEAGLPPPAISEQRSAHASDLPWIIHRYGAALLAVMADEGWENARREDGYISPRGNIIGGHAVVAHWYDLYNDRIGGSNWWPNPRWSMSSAGLHQQYVYAYGLDVKWERGPK